MDIVRRLESKNDRHYRELRNLLLEMFSVSGGSSANLYRRMVNSAQTVVETTHHLAVDLLSEELRERGFSRDDIEQAAVELRVAAYLRKTFVTAVLAVARQLSDGLVPLHIAGSGNRIATMSDSVRERVRASIGQGAIYLTDASGSMRTFSTDYYVALVVHSEIGRVGLWSALRRARTEDNLVRVSPQPSTIGDYCDLYRGRVFSLVPSLEFPHISECPSGGPPFHPWCHHFAIPISLSTARSYGQQDLIPQKFVELAKSGASPSEFQKLWRKQ